MTSSETKVISSKLRDFEDWVNFEDRLSLRRLNELRRLIELKDRER